MTTKTIQTPNFGTVQLNELTVGDIMDSTDLKDTEQVLFLVSKAMKKPKYTAKQLRDLPIKYMNDFSLIASEVQEV